MIASMTTIEPTPIRLVTFDLYDTLIELDPTRWDRLSAVLTAMNIDHDPELLKAGDLVAEDYYTEINTIEPIRDRETDVQDEIRIEYMRRWLRAAGLDVDRDLAATIRNAYRAEYETRARESIPGLVDGYRVFPDVNRTMQRLRAAGVRCAVISNADDDVTDFCTRLQFAHEMDMIVTSALVGYEKPDIRTFQAALEPLDIPGPDALHIGDQPRSDVAGALATGMRAALIDRYHRHDPNAHTVPIFHSLDDLADEVLAINELTGATA
jgi:HAD superfamily hydrolase (TIGR01549 family)